MKAVMQLFTHIINMIMPIQNWRFDKNMYTDYENESKPENHDGAETRALVAKLRTRDASLFST